MTGIIDFKDLLGGIKMGLEVAREYEKYEQQGLKFLDDFKTTNEMFTNSRKKYVDTISFKRMAQRWCQ